MFQGNQFAEKGALRDAVAVRQVVGEQFEPHVLGRVALRLGGPVREAPHLRLDREFLFGRGPGADSPRTKSSGEGRG
jgi:hypothetical protein